MLVRVAALPLSAPGGRDSMVETAAQRSL